GRVDIGDFGVWRSHYSGSAAGGSLAGSSVPEPTTCMLMVTLAAFVTVAGRRRGRELRLPRLSWPSALARAASAAAGAFHLGRQSRSRDCRFDSNKVGRLLTGNARTVARRGFFSRTRHVVPTDRFQNR